MIEEVQIAGVTYITHDALIVGDYIGAGAVGVANMRALDKIADKEDIDQEVYTFRTWQGFREAADGGYHPWPRVYRAGTWEPIPAPTAGFVELIGYFGSRQVWVRADCAPLADAVRGLESYPLIDDDVLSEVEAEREQEAWDIWLRGDLMRSLSDDVKDFADELEDDELWGFYLTAKDETNTYPVDEYGGCFVDVEHIAPVFEREIIARARAAGVIFERDPDDGEWYRRD